MQIMALEFIDYDRLSEKLASLGGQSANVGITRPLRTNKETLQWTAMGVACCPYRPHYILTH
jgi:hypothetical protein